MALPPVSRSQIELVVNDSEEPLPIPMEDKAIDADSLVPSNAYPVDEVLLVTDGTDGGKEPAIAIEALPYVARRSIINVELGFLEYVLHDIRTLLDSVARVSGHGPYDLR